MNYYDLIKKYGSGKGEAVMWAAAKRVSEYLEELKEREPERYWGIIKETYADMCGPHFNEEFAVWQIEQMFYKDMNGEVHYAPNWSVQQYRNSFEMYKSKLRNKAYTCWDWAVAIEMCYTDNHCLLKMWFPNATEDEIKAKALDMAVNYLNDDDDNDEGRIWHRFNKV